MLYLDTHVVVWLYAGQIDRFSPHAAELIEANDLVISPIVLLELQYLKEIGRLTVDPGIVFEYLSATIGLTLSDQKLTRIVFEAITMTWTRDPFDRIIAAQAMIDGDLLLTKDRSILDNCPQARWE